LTANDTSFTDSRALENQLGRSQVDFEINENMILILF
jgi:hypothetical protein